MQVLDYSAGFPGAAAIKTAGYLGAVRYTGLPGNPKNTTAGELADFRAHGLGMALVFERLTTDWRMGYAGGQTFGRQARDHANAIGFHADRPIYMAIDSQVSGAAEHDTAMAYIAGASSVLGGPERTGVYGQASVCALARTRSLAAYRWQTKAWSGGVVAEGVHLLQLIGTVYVGGIACDINDVLAADWGQHNGGGDMSAQDVNDALTQTHWNALGGRNVIDGLGELLARTLTATDTTFPRILSAAQSAANRPAVELTEEQAQDIATRVTDAILGGQFDVTITRKTS